MVLYACQFVASYTFMQCVTRQAQAASSSLLPTWVSEGRQHFPPYTAGGPSPTQGFLIRRGELESEEEEACFGG